MHHVNTIKLKEKGGVDSLATVLPPSHAGKQTSHQSS